MGCILSTADYESEIEEEIEARFQIYLANRTQHYTIEKMPGIEISTDGSEKNHNIHLQKLFQDEYTRNIIQYGYMYRREKKYRRCSNPDG